MILNRGMGEQLTYGIPARYCVVLVECLGGFFFDGRRSCAKDSFAGHSGLLGSITARSCALNIMTDSHIIPSHSTEYLSIDGSCEFLGLFCYIHIR